MAPFVGDTFRPEQPFSTFDGETAMGTWKLIISDDALDNQGVLHCWYVDVTPESV